MGDIEYIKVLGRGLDAKSEKMSNAPNQMNIKSMYSDIDLDAKGMETEFQAALQELLWFIKMHIANTGGYTSEAEVHIIFNKNIMMNETETIQNCTNSTGIISDKTIIANHPWVNDADRELELLEEQNNMVVGESLYGELNEKLLDKKKYPNDSR